MSRFSTTIKCLEDKIYQQLRLAQELEAENAKLHKQEQALCLTLASLQGSMAALMGDRHRMQQAQYSFHTAGPTPVASTGSERPTATSSSSSSSCPPLELLAAGTEVTGTASSSTADAVSRLSSEDSAACWMDLQQQLVGMEQLLQGDRQQVIRVGSTCQQDVDLVYGVGGATGAVGSCDPFSNQASITPGCDQVTLAAATTAALLPRCCCVQLT